MRLFPLVVVQVAIQSPTFQRSGSRSCRKAQFDVSRLLSFDGSAIFSITVSIVVVVLSYCDVSASDPPICLLGHELKSLLRALALTLQFLFGIRAGWNIL